MKKFAAFCVLAVAGFAFHIQSIDDLDFQDYTMDGIVEDEPKKTKKTATVTLLPQVPAFNKEEGYDEMIDELIAEQKACAEDAHSCKIEPDEESKNAEFGLGELLDGVAEGFDKLVKANAKTEKQAIDKIGEDTNKQIDAQIKAATESATAQLVH